MSGRRRPGTVKQIAFDLPVGDPKAPESTDLTETAAGIGASVSSSGPETWQIAAGAAAGSFVLTPGPENPGVIDTQGLVVTLVGIQVGPIVGTAVVRIVELVTANASAPAPRVGAIDVAKFPYGFYAGNFAAGAPMVADGGTVTLSWVGSVQARYTLLWAEQSQDVSTLNQWTSPPLVDTTAFIPEVSAQQGGETVVLRFSLTVIVADPQITATTLDVLTTSMLNGSVGIGTTGNPSSLTVNGTATASAMSAGALTVAGASQLAALTVSGGVTAGSMSTSSLSRAARRSRAPPCAGSMRAAARWRWSPVTRSRSRAGRGTRRQGSRHRPTATSS